MGCLWSLTFELSRHQRCDARARVARMYRVPPARAWWLAVGPRLERGVRPHLPCPRKAARSGSRAMLTDPCKCGKTMLPP